MYISLVASSRYTLDNIIWNAPIKSHLNALVPKQKTNITNTTHDPICLQRKNTLPNTPRRNSSGLHVRLVVEVQLAVAVERIVQTVYRRDAQADAATDGTPLKSG